MLREKEEDFAIYNYMDHAVSLGFVYCTFVVEGKEDFIICNCMDLSLGFMFCLQHLFGIM